MNQESEHDLFEFEPFRLDATEGVLIRDGETVHLTPKALKLLIVLVRHSNHILDKEMLMGEVWPDTIVEESNLAGNIHTLRQILGEGSDEQKYIETIPRRGYRFVAKVRGLRDGNAQSDVVVGKDHSVEVLQTSTTTIGTGPVRKKGLRAKIPGLLFTVVGVAVIALFGWIWLRLQAVQPNVPITSIAVLPLKNLSGESAEDYFADGMTEALITELAKIRALRVISRTSMMQYKDARKSIPQIARELNVDAVVEGSVLRSDNHVRITAQLIKATTDEHLWAESYERNLEDVLSLQREIARAIAGKIRIELTPEEQERLRSAHSTNPEAHEANLKGFYYLHQAKNSPDVKEFDQLHKKSFEYFEQALRIDPNNAIAYSGLAESYHWLASGGFPEFYPKAKDAALKSLALDDTLDKAHGALAFTVWRHEWDFALAEREFKRALDLSPGSTHIHGYAWFLSSLGRHDEALEKIAIARDVDPLTLPLKTIIGWIYVNARQYDQAIVQFRTVLELDPKQFEAHYGLGEAYILKGMYDEGTAEFRRAVELSSTSRAGLAWAYAMAGRRKEAIQILSDLMNPHQRDSVTHANLAMIYGALGEKDLGIEQLEKAIAKRRGVLGLKVNPEFDGLRSHPRFDDLLRRIGFPP